VTSVLDEANASRVRRLRRLEQEIAEAILVAHHRLWPPELAGQYTVVHRVGPGGTGKAKVQFGPPPVKDEGFPVD
jgi:hypothetical protein